MVKAAAKKTTAKPGKAVATTGSKALKMADVDVSLLEEQDAGRGVSNAAEDNIVPLVKIVQALSPVALKQKQEYIKGATAGMIWPSGSKIIINGEEEGISVIPAAMTKWWLEWRPDRGGFAGRHKYVTTSPTKGRPEGAEWVPDPKGDGGKWVMPSGNHLQESREHAVIALIDGEWQDVCISMTGSNHKASRAWNTAQRHKKTPKGNRAPSYSNVYTLTTIPRENDKGAWYMWQHNEGFEYSGDVTRTVDLENGTALWMRARQLNQDFEGGVRVAEADEDVSGSNTADDDSDDM